MDFIAFIVLAFGSYWVFADVKKHGGTTVTGLAWATGVFFIFIIVLPLWLFWGRKKASGNVITTSIFCRYCGAQSEMNGSFCTRCGKPLGSDNLNEHQATAVESSDFQTTDKSNVKNSSKGDSKMTKGHHMNITSNSLNQLFQEFSPTGDGMNDAQTLFDISSKARSMFNEASNRKSEMSEDDLLRLDSADSYLTDADAILRCESWDQIQEVIDESMTDVGGFLENEMYDEGEFDFVIEMLQSKFDDPEAFAADLGFRYALYNAGYEFEQIELFQ